MSETTARFELPYIMPSQAQKHVTHNEALREIEGQLTQGWDWALGRETTAGLACARPRCTMLGWTFM